MALRAVYGGGGITIEGGPSSPDLTVFNPVQTTYLHGDESHVDGWRMRVTGAHPAHDTLLIEHRVTLNETDIELDDAKVASIEADLTFTENNRFHASVLTDSRVDQNIPAALAGNMENRVIVWDGSLWINSLDQWIEKANFKNSLHSDRGIFQRMNIINTDPDDPRAYPPTPEQGVTLGTRFTSLMGENLIGAHLSLMTADGIFGMFPFMSQGGPPEANASIDHIVAFKLDGETAALPYGNNHTNQNWEAGDDVITSGLRYINTVYGQQSNDWSTEASKWAPQDPVKILNAAITTIAGEMVVSEAGNVIRGLAS